MTPEHRCPGDELLVAYAAAELDAVERDRVERHLAECDDCLETVRCIHSRLTATADGLVSPPVAVARKARAASSQSAAAPRVPLPLRLPILIPASLAAGLLMVFASQSWLMPNAGMRERSADIRRAGRATSVWSQPSVRAEVVAEIVAGEIVEVRREQAGWCNIALGERGDGWIECGALQ
jgi:anti-sigma factor RsiW